MYVKTARFISNVFNPFLMAFAIILLLGFKDSMDTLYSLKWVGIALLVSVVPTLVAAMWLVRGRKLDGLFTNPRQQRTRIYVVSTLIGAVGLAIAWLFDAPLLLRATFTAGFVAVLIFMVINFYWKISLHTAFVSASATLLAMVYGGLGALSFLLLPMVGWSRITLKQHTPYQVLGGAACSAAVVITAFHLCGAF